MEVIDWSDRSVVACPSLKEVEMQEDPKEMTTDRAWDYSEEMARRLQQVSECYLVQQTVLPTSEAEIQHFALIQDCVQKLLQPEAYSHSHEAREEEVIDCWDATPSSFGSSWELELQEMLKERGVEIDITDVDEDEAREMYLLLKQNSNQKAQCDAILTSVEASTCNYRQTLQDVAALEEERDLLMKDIEPVAAIQEEKVIDCWDESQSPLDRCWERELQEMLKERGVEAEVADMEEDEAQELYALLKQNRSQQTQCDALSTSVEASTCNYRQTLQDIADLEEERNLLMKDIEVSIPMSIPASGIESTKQTSLYKSKVDMQLVASIQEGMQKFLQPETCWYSREEKAVEEEDEVIDCWDATLSSLGSRWELELQEMLNERGAEADVADMDEDEAQELYALLKQNSSQKAQHNALLSSVGASVCNYSRTLQDIAALEEDRNLMMKDIEKSIPTPIPASGIESPDHTLLSESKAGTQLLASIQDDDRMPIAASGDNCPEMTPECEIPLVDTCAHFKSNLQNLKRLDAEEPWSSDDEGSTVASSGPTDVNTLCLQSTESDLDDKLEHHVGVSCARGEKEALRYSFFARAPSL